MRHSSARSTDQADRQADSSNWDKNSQLHTREVTTNRTDRAHLRCSSTGDEKDRRSRILAGTVCRPLPVGSVRWHSPTFQ